MQILSIKNRKSDIFLALLLTVFIISLAVVITVFFKPLYYFDIDYLHISETTGLSVDVIRHNYDVLIQYQSLFYQGTLNLPDFVMSNSIPTVIGFLAAIDFNKAFVIFHQIVFRNDYWIFNEATDPVITILPEAFFMHCFMMIVGIVMAISAGLYAYYCIQKKRILQNT